MESQSNLLDIICEKFDKLEITLSLTKPKLLAVLITTNHKLSNQYLVQNYDVNLPYFSYGTIRILDTFHHTGYVIRVKITAAEGTQKNLSNIFKRLKEEYHVDSTIPMIYLKTCDSSQLLTNIQAIFENVTIAS